MSELEKKKDEELNKELSDLKIKYSRMFLAASLKATLHEISQQMKELKAELNKRNNQQITS
jgi:hypothetical protein